MPRTYVRTGRPNGVKVPKKKLIPPALAEYLKTEGPRLQEEQRQKEIEKKAEKPAPKKGPKVGVFADGELEIRLRKVFESQDEWVERLKNPLKGIATADDLEKASFEEKKRLFIIALSICGMTTLAAKAVGFYTTHQLRAARGLDKVFAEEWDNALKLGAEELLEEVAMVRAVAGTDEPVYFQGEVVGHKKNYDNSLLQFLLKAANPSKYGTSNVKVDADMKGTFGFAVVPATVLDEDEWERQAMQTVEEQRKLIEAMDKKLLTDVPYEAEAVNE